MADLKSERLKVAGRALTVFQASFVMSLQRSIAIANAGSETPKFYKNLDEQVVQYVHRLLYPSLAACTEGKVPSEEEFLRLPEADVNAWLDAAQRLNPDWFSLNGARAEESEKKDSQPS